MRDVRTRLTAPPATRRALAHASRLHDRRKFHVGQRGSDRRVPQVRVADKIRVVAAEVGFGLPAGGDRAGPVVAQPRGMSWVAVYAGVAADVSRVGDRVAAVGTRPFAPPVL